MIIWYITVILVGFLPSLIDAFWIISHSPLISERLDPIVTGTEPSGHVHAFVGSSAIFGKRLSKKCTTSIVKDDRSRYWSPQLYYYAANSNSFFSVPLQFVNTYYLNRGGPSMGSNPSLKAFPHGFKMIAGNASNFDQPLSNTAAANAISFVCLDYKNGSQETKTLPTKPCPDGLRTQIMFPSCWDGKHLDSKNHQSHVSYPIGSDSSVGDCPSSHPIKFQSLFYEFIWDVKNLTSGTNGTLVLANGDTVGYSFHADFISGWKVKTLQAAIDQCTGDLFGDLDRCVPFQKSLQSSTKCTTSPILEEQAVGTLKVLPGCNVVQNGPFKGAGKCRTKHRKIRKL